MRQRRSACDAEPSAARRRWLRCACAVAAWPCVAAHRGAWAQNYTATIAAMREARESEMAVYYRYTEFARQAQQEGYRGIAYLFVAFGSAEMIHATNFGRILARLNVEVQPVAKPRVSVGSTRDNLLAAAEIEARSVDEYYPKLLERIRPEGHQDAMDAVQFAWGTEKQHREKMRQIQRWSPAFFDQVAKHIDKKTGQYFVCQICGNTVNVVPEGSCPVCKNPSSHFRLIDPPA
jgi:rubrerythrin